MIGGRNWGIAGRSGAISIAMTAVALTGCAKFSPDGGMTFVAEQTSGILGKGAVRIRTEDDASAARNRVRSLLSRRLTADSAVEIALLNNRALQAAYNDLGISEAQMVEASLPPAPSFSLSYVTGTGFEIERQLAQDVLALFTLPRRREIAEDQFRAAQIRAVEVTLRTGAEARRSYYRAVAAAQIVKFLEEARLSAESVSELAKKLGETGAMPKLDQAREHAFYAEVSSDLAVARLKARSEREALNRALGLWGSDLQYRLPDKLDALPAKPRVAEQIEIEAIRSRADLEIARMDLVALAKQYDLTRAVRFVDVLEVSGKSIREHTPASDVAYGINPGPPPVLTTTETPSVEKIRRDGVDIAFRIPIYDFGEARTRMAEEAYLKGVNLLIDKAVNVRADARQAYQVYRGSYDIARHYEKEILPLREIISEEALLNYNGMLSDLFSLLADARLRLAANVKAIEAKREFWLASVDLQAAIHGGGLGGAGESPAVRVSDSSN
jgi:outer membrane protein TolC